MKELGLQRKVVALNSGADQDFQVPLGLQSWHRIIQILRITSVLFLQPFLGKSVHSEFGLNLEAYKIPFWS